MILAIVAVTMPYWFVGLIVLGLRIAGRLSPIPSDACLQGDGK